MSRLISVITKFEYQIVSNIDKFKYTMFNTADYIGLLDSNLQSKIHKCGNDTFQMNYSLYIVSSIRQCLINIDFIAIYNLQFAMSLGIWNNTAFHTDRNHFFLLIKSLSLETIQTIN